MMTTSETSASPNRAEADPAYRALKSALGKWQGDFLLQDEMPGGASTRRFFRLTRDSVPMVAMYIPAPSQAIAKARQSSGPAPFVEVAEELQKAGVAVPKIFERDDDHNILLVEDLGDDTLENFLRRHPDARRQLYERAVKDLANAQASLTNLPADCIVSQRAFDEELLRWEVDHFRDWALLGRGIELNDEEMTIFNRSADFLSKTIAGWQRTFVHRDYQSRNLMVKEAAGALQLTWIDFQDAMMGPRAYDLVALLTDSYQDLSRAFVEERLDEFCQARGIAHQRNQLIFEFDFLSVQRKLKDAGRFIFMDRVNKNPSFLPYVDSTIDKARTALARVRDEGPLVELEALLNRLL